MSALNANDQTAFGYFVGKGLTAFQAAGIVGNLDQESNDDPTAVESGGPGRGIAQWSVGGRWDTDANDNVVWYAGQQGQSSTSFPLQLDFIWYELTTFSDYGLASLQQTTNVTDATIAFEDDFEGCSQCDQSQRIAYAEAALAAYGATVPADAGAADAGSPIEDSGAARDAATSDASGGVVGSAHDAAAPVTTPGPAEDDAGEEGARAPLAASESSGGCDVGAPSHGSRSGGLALFGVALAFALRVRRTKPPLLAGGRAPRARWPHAFAHASRGARARRTS